MRKEKRYCKKRFDQSEIKMKIKRTPLNLETWPKIHLWHRQMPGDAPKPLQNESSKKKKKAAKFCSKINSKFKNSQVSIMNLRFVFIYLRKRIIYRRFMRVFMGTILSEPLTNDP